MKNTTRVICLFLSLVVVPAAYAAEMTEEMVKQTISRVDNAVNDLNARALAKELSDNVSITMNINMQGQKQVMKPSKQEYISMLAKGWAQYKNYKYSRTNMSIKIKGNKAYISADIKESMTMQGKNIL